MKNTDKSPVTISSFDQLISKLSENEILNTQAMSYVRGGAADGEGDGGASVIIMPKPPK
jgi:hypothetical protein